MAQANAMNGSSGVSDASPAGLARLTRPEADPEALLRSTVDALSAHVAVLDETGTIVMVNQAWKEFAASTGYTGQNFGVGSNYLAVCERASAASEDAARTAKALREVIAGSRHSYRLEYPCTGPDGPRWFQLRVTCANAANTRRLVIAHEDITDVKLAEEALARLNARILQLQDAERRRIARELHDTTAQNLLVISLNAARLTDHRRSADPFVHRMATEIAELTEQSLQEIRTLAYLLHPPVLDELGLESALRWLAKGFSERSGVTVEARIEEVGSYIAQETATTLFRVAQEALANVHRHSGSTWARITLSVDSDALELCIEDQGLGLYSNGNDGDQAFGVGIAGMRVRLEQLGGRLELQPRAPGLLVRAIVPLTEAVDRHGPRSDRSH